jgi:N-acetylmuramoyl-L-alanine amidase
VAALPQTPTQSQTPQPPKTPTPGRRQARRRRRKRQRLILLSAVLALTVLGLILHLRGGQTAEGGDLPPDDAPAILMPLPDGHIYTRIPVIDAGHGGEDGGAISVTGVREAEINLQVAVKIDLLMHFFGVPSVMLRTEDISLHDPSAQTIQEKKRSDLQNRAATVNGIQNAVLLSIHQNTFTDPQYSGLQAFYTPAEGSKALAERIQSTVKTSLDTTNTRLAAKAREDIYVLANVNCPAVLVECGFMSHLEEEKKLREDGYQTKLAAAITASFLQWEVGVNP